MCGSSATPLGLQLHKIGTAASIRQLTWRSLPTPHYNVIMVGLCRFKVQEIREKTPILVAKITLLALGVSFPRHS